jgi:hypothetical protein
VSQATFVSWSDCRSLIVGTSRPSPIPGQVRSSRQLLLAGVCAHQPNDHVADTIDNLTNRGARQPCSSSVPLTLTVIRILRHSTVATTQSHYIKTASPDAIAAMKQFSEGLLCSTFAPDGDVKSKGSVQ